MVLISWGLINIINKRDFCHYSEAFALPGPLMLVNWSWELSSDLRAASLSTGKCFHGVSTQKLCSRGGQGCTWCWQPNLVLCNRHPSGTSFKGMKGSLKGSGGLALRKFRGGHRWQLKAQEWAGLVEKLRFGTWGEPRRDYWWKCRPLAAEIPGFWRCRSHGITTKDSSHGASLSRWDKLCAAEGGGRKVAKTLGGIQKVVSWPHVISFVLMGFGLLCSDDVLGWCLCA